MKLGSELFIKRKDIPDVISGAPGKVTVNAAGPDGMSNSEHSTGSHRSKISNVLSSFIDLMDGEVTVAGVSTMPAIDGVYLEISSKGEAPTAFLWKDTSVMCSVKEPSTTDKVLGATAFMLSSKNSKFEEFQRTYKKCAESYNKGGKIQYEDALLLCDSFYYTLRASYLYDRGIEIPTDSEELTDETIAQLGRSLRPPYEKVDMQTVVTIDIQKMKLDEDTAEASAATTTPKTSILQRAMDGEFILPYEWDEEERMEIPPLSVLEEFVPSKEYNDALIMYHCAALDILDRMNSGKTGEKAIGNDGAGLTFIGKPGTGKSTIIKAIAASLQVPLYILPMTKNGEEDAFQGMLKLNHEESATGSSFKLVETPFLKAFMKGGLVCLEEFNLADPGMLMGVLGQAIEKPYILLKDGYETIERHPLCMLAATCNVATQGSIPPSEAFASRNPTTIEVGDPEEKAFIDLLKQQSGADAKTCKRIFRCYRSILDYLSNQDNEDLIKVLTLRHCSKCLTMIQRGIDMKRAVIYHLVNPIKLFAPDVAQEVQAGCVDTVFND